MNKKILIVFLILIFFFSIFSTHVFAGTGIFLPKSQLELPATIPTDEFSDYVIVDTSSIGWLIKFENVNEFPVVAVDNSGVDGVNIISPGCYSDNNSYVFNEEKKLANLYQLTSSGGEWVFYRTLYDKDRNSSTNLGYDGADCIVYSSCDLKGSYKSYGRYEFVDDILFQKAPVPFIPMALTQVEELKAGAMMVVNLILPVCLAIFGILLLVYLIRSKKLLHLS